MKRQRKRYQSPTKPWDKTRLEMERVLLKDFGLKNKKEIWKMQAMLRKYRKLARGLVAKHDDKLQQVIMERLTKFGLVTEGATTDTILSLTLEDFLNRRLQTVLQKKGIANTVKQARQFITHGHVLIDNRRVTYPSYLVPVDEEDRIVIKANPVRKTSDTNGETAAN